MASGTRGILIGGAVEKGGSLADGRSQ